MADAQEEDKQKEHIHRGMVTAQAGVQQKKTKCMYREMVVADKGLETC